MKKQLKPDWERLYKSEYAKPLNALGFLKVSCPVCKAIEFEDDLNGHLKKNHPDEHYRLAPYRCKYCARIRFYSAKLYLRHVNLCSRGKSAADGKSPNIAYKDEMVGTNLDTLVLSNRPPPLHTKPVEEKVQSPVKALTLADALTNALNAPSTALTHSYIPRLPYTPQCLYVRINCPLCDRQFKSLIGLNRHQMSCHELWNGTRYSCTGCGEEWNNVRELNNHLVQQFAKNDVRCLDTGVAKHRVDGAYVNIKDLKSKRANVKQIEEAPITLGISESKKVKESEMVYRTMLIPLNCPFCRRRCANMQNLYTHQTMWHKEEDRCKFGCFGCKEAWDKPINLRTHLYQQALAGVLICTDSAALLPSDSPFMVRPMDTMGQIT